MTSQRRDIIGGIQSKFVYQFTSLDYHEPVEDLEVKENTNINVLEEIKENYLRPFAYAKAQVNVLDEVPQSYSHQRNPELDQIRYTTETRDQEFLDSRITRLLSRIYAFCEEEGHVIMDCPFMFFHIRASIVRHVEI